MKTEKVIADIRIRASKAKKLLFVRDVSNGIGIICVDRHNHQVRRATLPRSKRDVGNAAGVFSVLGL